VKVVLNFFASLSKSPTQSKRLHVAWILNSTWDGSISCKNTQVIQLQLNAAYMPYGYRGQTLRGKSNGSYKYLHIRTCVGQIFSLQQCFRVEIYKETVVKKTVYCTFRNRLTHISPRSKKCVINTLPFWYALPAFVVALRIATPGISKIRILWTSVRELQKDLRNMWKIIWILILKTKFNPLNGYIKVLLCTYVLKSKKILIFEGLFLWFWDTPRDRWIKERINYETP